MPIRFFLAIVALCGSITALNAQASLKLPATVKVDPAALELKHPNIAALTIPI